MARYVSTKSASGGTIGGGGASGPTAAEVCQYACKAVCDLFCTNLKTTACRPLLNYLPTTQNCYTLICHCNCWTTCFCNGCFKIDIDTNKYRGFRICFAGFRLCGCNTNTMYAGVVSSNGCMCCCTQTYSWMHSCNKWPQGCNCFCYLGNCWCCGPQPYWCYTCMSGIDGTGFFDFTLEANSYNRPYCNCSPDWGFDVCWISSNEGNFARNFPGQCSRVKGAPYCNKSTMWSRNQKANDYVCAICFCANQTLMSTICAGCYAQTCVGDVNLPHPIPNWSIWGWPCCFPVNVGVWSGTEQPDPNEAYE